MREVLNAVVQVAGDHAIALGAVDDRVTALKRMLARQFPELADELKAQIEEEQEQSRTGLYELQVALARVREAIAKLPEGDEAKAEEKVVRKRRASKAPARAAGRRVASR